MPRILVFQHVAAEPLGTLPAGTSILLRGRIDRIDFNKKLGRWRALDYKSSSKGASPSNLTLPSW